jgi:radical SAM superfamily enzyme YgiQ (UPF0313 family)
MTQINTPYPATAYLTGFLRGRGFDVVQADPALELVLRLFSRAGLAAIKDEFEKKYDSRNAPKSVRHFLYHYDAYYRTIDAVVRFLQGRDPTLAHRITNDGFLPQGPRFRVLEDYDADGNDGLGMAFGSLGLQDRAQHLASLYIDDLADVIREGVDPKFELSRYAEKLAASAPSFDPILESLGGPATLVDQFLDDITRELFEQHHPAVVGMTLPFPGNVYGAFRMAQTIRRLSPSTKIIFGGGYVNTEWRELAEPRVFDFVDYITLDDGEKPLLTILESLAEGKAPTKLLRTLVRDAGGVVQRTDKTLHDIPLKDAGTPTYDGLPLEKYLSLCELLNPMHRLWSDGRWNKLTLAHGCYWKKCSFCDVSLDYIGRYEPQAADDLVDRIEALVRETGQTGFHFVDEAAPPKLLDALARRLIERRVVITWWGNIRFEKTFTPELVKRLADSGCIAVSGGLEVASDRLLTLMQKGVTVEQVARVTHAFTNAGIMVHAYLMYGFPTETVQETVDALERVRQLFAAGCLQSAYWHRFSATVHSPIGLEPEKYGITLRPVPSTFAKNDVAFEDPTGVDHDALHPGLKKAIYNYMHGIGLDEDVRSWFNIPVPRAKVPKSLVTSALKGNS